MYTEGGHMSSFSLLMIMYYVSRQNENHKQSKAAFSLNGSLTMRKHDIYM